jgi:hypothetical protein
MKNSLFTTSYEGSNGNPNIPIGRWKGGWWNGKIVFIEKDPKPDQIPIREIRDSKGELEIVPSEEYRVIYLGAPSGSGKSYLAGQYIEKYKKMCPKNPFFLISLKDEDPALDHLHPNRIMINEELVTTPLQVDDFKECIILFDDIDNIHDKKQQDAINKFICRVMEVGRSRYIHAIVTSHLINAKDAKSRQIMNEMQLFIFFPGSGSTYQIKYCLKTYFGLSPQEIEKILRIHDSRWIVLGKSHPQFLMTQHEAIFMNDLIGEFEKSSCKKYINKKVPIIENGDRRRY